MNKEELIKATILGEEHLGENLKGICIEYIDNLQQENQKYKEVIDRIEKYIEKETRIYGLSMSIELGTHFDNILGILKEVE